MPPGERLWFGDSSVAQFRKLNLVYLPLAGHQESVGISGVRFPSLGELRIGSGQLHLLGCPESASTHTADQMLVLYSANPRPFEQKSGPGSFLPTDDVLFSGDLWLMRGPRAGTRLSHIGRRLKHRLAGMMRRLPRDFREQDSGAKEALKKGFCLVRVKPGHGDEFLGARIISNSLLADRDVLLELGYRPTVSAAVLQKEEMAPRVTAMNERAYSYFVSELRLWLQLGFNPDDMRTMLVRVHVEQSGGIPAVRKDRRQRRRRLRQMLLRLSGDQTQGSSLRTLAQSTLARLGRQGDGRDSVSDPIPSHWKIA